MKRLRLDFDRSTLHGIAWTLVAVITCRQIVAFISFWDAMYVIVFLAAAASLVLSITHMDRAKVAPPGAASPARRALSDYDDDETLPYSKPIAPPWQSYVPDLLADAEIADAEARPRTPIEPKADPLTRMVNNRIDPMTRGRERVGADAATYRRPVEGVGGGDG